MSGRGAAGRHMWTHPPPIAVDPPGMKAPQGSQALRRDAVSGPRSRAIFALIILAAFLLRRDAVSGPRSRPDTANAPPGQTTTRVRLAL